MRVMELFGSLMTVYTIVLLCDCNDLCIMIGIDGAKGNWILLDCEYIFFPSISIQKTLSR